MSKEIVKYNNDFNLMPMPEFLAKEMDIFMFILSKLKFEKKDLEFDAYDFFRAIKEPKESYELLIKTFKDFAKKILNYTISYETKQASYNFVCFTDCDLIYEKNKIVIKTHQKFYDMVINYNLGYTRFELVEFTNLSSKYAKILYRLLKQFRTTGKAFLKWDEFTRIMQIPKDYQMGNIDQRILKPALKELSKEQTLFDSVRTPFENLSYTKIKDNGRGRGGKVIGIEFTFKPQKADKKLLENSIKSSNADKIFETWDILQTYYFTSSAKSFENLGVFSVGSCERLPTHIEVDFIGENKKIRLKFENAEQLQNAIKAFTIYEN